MVMMEIEAKLAEKGTECSPSELKEAIRGC
jgi:hypothetical protein